MQTDSMMLMLMLQTGFELLRSRIDEELRIVMQCHIAVVLWKIHAMTQFQYNIRFP
jgi:hypothetical protein